MVFIGEFALSRDGPTCFSVSEQVGSRDIFSPFGGAVYDTRLDVPANRLIKVGSFWLHVAAVRETTAAIG